MNPLDKMTGHFRNKISGEMAKIHIKEWEMDIYYKSANTLAEQGKLIELAQAGKTVEALVETLIMKARNEDGTKMFKSIDKVVMMNEVDPNILINVVSEMGAANDEFTVETAEKN